MDIQQLDPVPGFILKGLVTIGLNLQLGINLGYASMKSTIEQTDMMGTSSF